MKKLLSIALSLAITLGSSSIAMAAGNGVGLAAAPGQSVNFSKGVTTIVTTTVNVVNSTEDKTVVSDPVVVNTEDKSSTNTSTEDIKTTTGVETKTDKDGNIYTRNVYSTQTKTITTTKTWVDTTTAVTTSKYEIPVTTTYTTVRTLQHQGAPGSNGKVISDTTDTKVDVVKGTPVLLSSETKETTTSGTVTTKETVSYSAPVVTKDGWHLGQN